MSKKDMFGDLYQLLIKENPQLKEQIDSKQFSECFESVMENYEVAPKEKKVFLTGEPVSEKMQDILVRLAENENVPMWEINDTKEMELAHRIVASGTETYYIQGRKGLRNKWKNDLLSRGSFTIDENGKEAYNGIVEQGSRLDIVVGLPASGKSSTLVNPLSQEFHSRIIDNDEVKKMIPEFNNGWGADLVHKESQDVADEAFDLALENRDNIVLPKVGSDYEKLKENYVDKAIKAGYQVNLHYVELARSKSRGRMINRFLEEGRFLEPGIIDKYFDENSMSKIERTFNQFIEGGKIHEYSKWSNDVKRGERSILLDANSTAEFIKSAGNSLGSENAAGLAMGEYGGSRRTDNILQSGNGSRTGEIRENDIGRTDGSEIREFHQIFEPEAAERMGEVAPASVLGDKIPELSGKESDSTEYGEIRGDEAGRTAGMENTDVLSGDRRNRLSELASGTERETVTEQSIEQELRQIKAEILETGSPSEASVLAFEEAADAMLQVKADKIGKGEVLQNMRTTDLKNYDILKQHVFQTSCNPFDFHLPKEDFWNDRYENLLDDNSALSKQKERRMTGIIKVNGKDTTVKIGGVEVFTYEGAKEAYKKFASLAQDFEKYGAEGQYALSDEFLKMQELGFSPEEIEELENVSTEKSAEKKGDYKSILEEKTKEAEALNNHMPDKADKLQQGQEL